ncbi:hypothetical protein [Peribacillus asahii]|uniref:hypothetical protein n=1 Tax=Peribacillus asahii TaxID=228899 RepID=UPI00382E9ACC
MNKRRGTIKLIRSRGINLIEFEFEKDYTLIKMDRNNPRDRWHIQLKGKQPMCDHGVNLLNSPVTEHEGLDVPKSEKICGKCINNTLSTLKEIGKFANNSTLTILKARDQELRGYAVKNGIRLWDEEDKNE